VALGITNQQQDTGRLFRPACERRHTSTSFSQPNSSAGPCPDRLAGDRLRLRNLGLYPEDGRERA